MVCFHILATVNNAVKNTGIQITLWDLAYYFFEPIPRNGIAGLNDGFIFTFYRNHYPVFCGNCTILYLEHISFDPSSLFVLKMKHTGHLSWEKDVRGFLFSFGDIKDSP